MRIVVTCFVFLGIAFAQEAPNVESQREAMKKLSFLVGKWTGEANLLSGPGSPGKVLQTEEVQYKLDGLVMLVEGTGRDPATKQVRFRALATISYDDASKTYRFRAFNDGRYLDAELKVPEKGFEWGFKAGPANVRFVMHLNEKGEWVENGEVTVGNSPPIPTIQLVVRPQP